MYFPEGLEDTPFKQIQKKYYKRNIMQHFSADAPIFLKKF